MQIVEVRIGRGELFEIAKAGFGDMIKGVVDVERGLVAIDAELHADLEAMLLETGSRKESLWGINLYPEKDEGFVEFNSLINIRPSKNNRGRGVSDPAVREKIMEIISGWFE